MRLAPLLLALAVTAPALAASRETRIPDAALATANTLRQADQVPPPERRGPAPVSGAPDEIKSSPAVSRAREALTKIDALLKAAPR